MPKLLQKFGNITVKLRSNCNLGFDLEGLILFKSVIWDMQLWHNDINNKELRLETAGSDVTDAVFSIIKVNKGGKDYGLDGF